MTHTVLQISDTHFRQDVGDLVHGKDPDRQLADVISAWRRTGWTAELLVVPGDVADDGSAEAYERIHTALRALGAPIVALAGNHDDATALGSILGAATTADIGDWRLIAVPTAITGEIAGIVDVDETMAVIDGFDAQPTVLAMHHPPRSTSTHDWFRLERAEEFIVALSRRDHVRAVISGHLHEAFEMLGPCGLQLLGCPSTLVAIVHDGDHFLVQHDDPTGARVIRLEANGSLSSTILATRGSERSNA